MKFFLPESDDLVDPSYDFQNDLYGSDRKLDQRYDVYAHEIFGLPQCDGLLVTKSNISPRIAEQIQNCGGIHQYLRLPHQYPIMGDCGAFQYIAQDKPPYTCEEILDYYSNLGFDYGFTLDHVIVEFSLEIASLQHDYYQHYTVVSILIHHVIIISLISLSQEFQDVLRAS